ncbi:MAG: 4-alpha-glucanotransferase [Nitrospinae bacterium]|nr:4-alpha-glucanotransferase [Nitrospinota bacterium]
MKDIKDISNYLASTPSATHWSRIGVRRRAGILFPLFSLNTEANLGIGEFADLNLLAEWCSLTGHSIIQLLPLNDSGSSNVPYSAISAFALNPIHLSCSAMDGYEENEGLTVRIERIKLVCRSTKRVDYGYIFREKMSLYEDIYLLFREKERGNLSDSFDKYCLDNRDWLDDYGLYMALREEYRGERWEKWPREYKEYENNSLEVFREGHGERINFYSYLQWQTEKQFLAAHNYAASKNVLICGDLPFLVARDSADVWSRQSLFHLDRSAGAPPDQFSELGQKWGFPTINREIDFQSGHDWHKKRLKQAEKFYDIYRIDHALGLYRIYSVMVDEPDARYGWFDPADESTWEKQGEYMMKMMLETSHMLPVAEDLGMVPDCVRPNLKSLGIPRTIVDRWERNYRGDYNYVAPSETEAIAAHYLSTHDTETVWEWWKNSESDRQDMYEAVSGDGFPPRVLDDELHEAILERCYRSNALWAINLPQDIFSGKIFSEKPELHRINIPSLISDSNWSYRFPITLDDLVSDKDAYIKGENRRIRKLIEDSGRI